MKELKVDQREKFSFLSSLLYLVTITFVVFKVFGSLEGPTRMGLFWVIMVFIAINIIGTSFGFTGTRRKLGHYQLYDPVELIIAKLIVNFGKLFIAGALMIGLFVFFSGVPLKNVSMFFQVFTLASLGLVSALTLMSSISIYSSNQNTLVSVLSLPLLIPILLIAMRVSLISENMFFDTATDSNLLMLFGIDMVMVVMSLLFISFTWKP